MENKKIPLSDFHFNIVVKMGQRYLLKTFPSDYFACFPNIFRKSVHLLCSHQNTLKTESFEDKKKKTHFNCRVFLPISYCASSNLSVPITS